MENIITSKNQTNFLETFFKTSEKETKSLFPESSDFISTLKQEVPELFKDLLSTFFPVDPKVIDNLEKLTNHFGIEKAKAFPSLFLATAFHRRDVGVEEGVVAPCGGIVIIFCIYFH